MVTGPRGKTDAKSKTRKEARVLLCSLRIGEDRRGRREGLDVAGAGETWNRLRSCMGSHNKITSTERRGEGDWKASSGFILPSIPILSKGSFVSALSCHGPTRLLKDNLVLVTASRERIGSVSISYAAPTKVKSVDRYLMAGGHVEG